MTNDSATTLRLLFPQSQSGNNPLYALPGGSPQRPGILRVEAGAGSGIDTEAWALAVAGFGDFVSRIPSPLGIVTLRLADGTAPKGFIVEAAAVRPAADITSFSGWRAYLAGEEPADMPPTIRISPRVPAEPASRSA